MKLPELFRNGRKEHDPGKRVSYHESGHGLVQVAHGLLPRFTSLKGITGTLGFNTESFYIGCDLGIDWEKKWPVYLLMLQFGGIVGEAFYCGFYNWAGARSDLENAGKERRIYNLSFDDYLQAWADTHELVEDHQDGLKTASARLFLDRVLGWEFWEEEILLSH